MAKTTTPAVLIDGEDDEALRVWSWGHEASAHTVRDHAGLIAAIGDVIEAGHDTLAVQGSDAFLGRVITCMMRHFEGVSTDLKVFALPATRGRSHVAEWLGKGASMEKRARYLLKNAKRGKLVRAHVSTLRLSDSAAQAPRHGFNFATGLFYDLEIIRRRGGISGATQLASLGVEVAQRARGEGVAPVSTTIMSRERQEVGPAPRGLMCGALPRSLFEIALSKRGGARMLGVDTEADAVALIARAKAPIAALRGEAGDPFGVIHLDGLTRYLFDGEDSVADERGITQVSPGPEVVMWC